MKLSLKRAVSLFLAISCFCLCFFPVQAKEEVITPWVIPVDPNKPSIGGEEDSGTGRVLMFSINANGVYDILGTKGTEKTFFRSELPSDAEELVCVAILDHSLREWPDIGAKLDGCVIYGICYWGYSPEYGEDVYRSVYSDSYAWDEVGNIKTSSFTIDSRLEDGEEYYLYVRNYYPAGYISGTLALYYE